MFVLVPGDNLVDSCTAICPSEVRGCDWRLYGLSSRNPEAGWTLVKEPVACMELSPGTLRIFGAVSSFASSSYPLGSLKDGTRCVRLLNLGILGSYGTVVLLQNSEMLLGPQGRFWSPEAALDPEIAFRTRRLSEDPEDPEVVLGPGGRLGTRRSIGNPEEGSNLSCVTIAVDEQANTLECTPRGAELQRQIDGLQSQVTDLHKARKTTENTELSSEVQSLKEEHSKQLELSAEKLNQLQT
ncbi:hypothetical protein F2Q70_00016792 [Brassica cretica]|uniref:Uncharacterized protein n=1 Tax=Brassica cretica TaxID=69181 RepID=A0A8S9HWT4_BRACR|nr:hypothetical protein F2Q70_00016792 [Brassica cretica]